MSALITKLLQNQIKTRGSSKGAYDVAKNLAKRTSIVIKFDNKPMYTIDYKSLKKSGFLDKNVIKATKSLASALALIASGGNFLFDGFNWTNTLVAGSIATLAFDSVAGKKMQEKDFKLSLRDGVIKDEAATNDVLNRRDDPVIFLKENLDAEKIQKDISCELFAKQVTDAFKIQEKG